MRKIQSLALGACALLAVACATPQAAVTPKLQLERVVVAPLNLAVHLPEELEGQREPVWRELVAFLESHNQRVSVLDSVEAGWVWEEVMEDMTRSDTPPALELALADFARRIGSEADYDLLVIPSLVVRRAQVRGEEASWDGVRRRVPMLAAPEYESFQMGGYLISKQGFTGSISAASLHVSMLDSNGESVFDGLGGLALIEEAGRDDRRSGRPWTLALRDRPFDIPDHLREGIGLAFEPAPTTLSAGVR